MKIYKLFLALLMLAAGGGATFGQGGPIVGQAFRYTPSGVQYFPGATVTICAANATVPLNGVCTPAENDANCCFTDALMSVPSPNPTLTDALANYPPLYGTPGNYIVCISGSNATTRCGSYVIPCVAGATATGCGGSGMPRLQLLGTPLVAGDFSFNGWGTGATISGIQGTDSAFLFTVTAGTAPSIAPTVTLTFHDGPWTSIQSQDCTMLSTSTGNFADFLPANNLSSLTLTYFDLPVATKTYSVSCVLSGRSNVIPASSAINPVVLNPTGFQNITNFGLGAPFFSASALSTFSAGITGGGNIGAIDLGSKALSTVHTWSAQQIFPDASIACTKLIGGCATGGTAVSVNGVAQGAAVNFGSLPAADPGNLQIAFKQGSGNASAQVPISGTGGTVCSVLGSLPSGHLIVADANGNCVDGGLDQWGSSTDVGGSTTCPTGGTTFDDQCTYTIPWATNFSNTSYRVVCTGIGPHDNDNAASGRLIPNGIVTRNVGSVTFIIASGGASHVLYTGGVTCHGHGT